MIRPSLAAALVVLVAACSQGSSPIDRGKNESLGHGELSGCHGHASSSIPSDGLYDLTTFGGPGDSQPVACGGSTSNGSWWYAASSQRFGCGAKLRIEANGRCVVAQVADYGPDVCVENAAGRPIIDASPLVSKALFGESELGWSDRAGIHVTEVDASTPTGTCQVVTTTASSTSVTTGSGGAGAGGGGGSAGAGASGGGGAGASGGGESGASSSTTGGGTPCVGDGDCNPGNDGSGMICTNHVCVPGCHHDYQCPGVTTCVNGFCQ